MSSPIQSPQEQLNVADIQVADRIRKDLGDITGLAKSIKEFGIIQPIVITITENGNPILVAGGRRLTALSRLGITTLTHGREFIYRGEEDDYTRKAVELEENLRRHNLSWHEEVLAKQQLLKLMEAKHGVATMGRPSASGTGGFGVNKLAEMLGENPSTTSRDLQTAQLITQFPLLKKMPTKQDALRRFNVAATVVDMQAGVATRKVPSTSTSTTAGTVPATPRQPVFPSPELPYRLYEGSFTDHIGSVDDGSIDLVLTDLPYDIGLGDSSAAHSAGLQGFADTDMDLPNMCNSVAQHSWRILKDNRYAVIFFGAAYFGDLRDALTNAGFSVDPYWFIWRRDRTAPPSPARYAKTYDPALICSKGTPTLLRPNLGNSIDVPSVRGDNRLQSAQKPLAVMDRFIFDMTAEGSIVVDMMAGSGSTGVAAVKAKRYAILFEKERSACSLIKARMASLK